jgi:hypothetical protein
VANRKQVLAIRRRSDVRPVALSGPFLAIGDSGESMPLNLGLNGPYGPDNLLAGLPATISQDVLVLLILKSPPAAANVS